MIFNKFLKLKIKLIKKILKIKLFKNNIFNKIIILYKFLKIKVIKISKIISCYNKIFFNHKWHNWLIKG